LVSEPRQAETRLAVAGDLPDKDLPVFATMIEAESRRGRNDSESNGAPGNRRHWIILSARSSSIVGMHVKRGKQVGLDFSMIARARRRRTLQHTHRLRFLARAAPQAKVESGRTFDAE
jgi:hypothetical protein